jgi:hypothetical protein
LQADGFASGYRRVELHVPILSRAYYG